MVKTVLKKNSYEDVHHHIIYFIKVKVENPTFQTKEDCSN